ncbi:MAG: ROK family protein [Candidatus Hydrogenedentota bacterium]|nr:MAG: ROK family protein [Candidatus Hydrogenedentota bacterium]
MRPSYYIGIDIGGLSLKTGIVTRRGELVLKEEYDAEKITSPSHLFLLLHDTITRLLGATAIQKQSLGGIGVGAPGWVNHDEGSVHELMNVATPAWQDVPLKEEFEREWDLKTFVDNDGNVMAVGELVYGAGRGHKNFVCITLGTAVGGAFVIDGEIYRGTQGLAAEIGHMTLDWNGLKCVCGAKGCLGRYVGSRLIVADACKRLKDSGGRNTEGVLEQMVSSGSTPLSPKLLAEAAEKGDKIAIEIWRETGFRLGVALAGLVNLLNPECFIIGGGLAKAGSILFDQMRDTMGSLAMNQLGKTTPVVEAQLGEDAGIIGAATLAMRCIEKTYSPSPSPID